MVLASKVRVRLPGRQFRKEKKMNWRRLYATHEIGFTVTLFAAFIAVFLAFFSGACRVTFHLRDDQSMKLVFLPVAIVIFMVLPKPLVKQLQKMGMISDPPAKFGPWFYGQ